MKKVFITLRPDFYRLQRRVVSLNPGQARYIHRDKKNLSLVHAWTLSITDIRMKSLKTGKTLIECSLMVSRPRGEGAG